MTAAINIYDKLFYKRAQDPEYLKFILGTHTTGEIETAIYYNMHGAMADNYAYVIARDIKWELINKIRKSKNHLQAAKSLQRKPDAVIINTCATIEKNLRKNGKAGMISGNNGLFGDSFLRWFGSSTFDGQEFYDCACKVSSTYPDDSSFYEDLTDEQLDELIKGTQPDQD